MQYLKVISAAVIIDDDAATAADVDLRLLVEYEVVKRRL